MIELWIPLTIAAAFFQNLRSAFQKHLTSKLSTAGAAYVRFFYAWPFAILYCFSLTIFLDLELPSPTFEFIVFCLLGGLCQIIFTFLLVWTFSFRNFTVGTVYSKTEVIQVAFLGFLFLGDQITWIALLAICLSFIGVVILSTAKNSGQGLLQNLSSSLANRVTILGLTCGAFLGASSVFFRGAALSLGGEGVIMQAAFTLVCALIFETVIMGGYLLIREPGEFSKTIIHWRHALPVGIFGVIASIFWFTAFTMENAAYVRALGQVELLFTFIASLFFFKEKITRKELTGTAMVLLAVLIITLYG